MTTSIDTTKYEFVEEIYYGAWLKSSYNSNYYHSKELKNVILEECDDDGFFQYYELNGYSIQHIGNYFGDGGIFEDYDGIVEIDTETC